MLKAAVIGGFLLFGAAFQRPTGEEPSDRGRAGDYLSRPSAWYSSDEAKQITDNVLSHQADNGGWPKNVSTTAKPYTGDRKKLKATFDNRATTDELRFLARVVDATEAQRYRDAFIKGLDHVLKAQYANGGWPQYYPPQENDYSRYITFNDGVMERLLRLVRDVADDEAYQFVDAEHRRAAADAFERGIGCVLKCQIKVDGKLTAWCAQHDEKDFSPRPARTFELASLSGCESAGIVEVLMGIKDPSPEVIAAVDGAMAWFDSAKIDGIRVERSTTLDGKRDRIVVEDASAPPMWARFYEIGTNKPIFADRDGVPKQHLSDIGYERRAGYSWLGNWPQKLSKKYAKWKQ